MKKIVEEITFVEDGFSISSGEWKRKTISFDQNDKPIVPDDFNGIIRETIKGRKRQIYHNYFDGVLTSSKKQLPDPDTYYDPIQKEIISWN